MSARLNLPPITVATNDYGRLMPLAKTLKHRTETRIQRVLSGAKL